MTHTPRHRAPQHAATYTAAAERAAAMRDPWLIPRHRAATYPATAPR